MRFSNERSGRSWIGLALATALLATTAMPSFAQIAIDGNLFFRNGNLNAQAGQQAPSAFFLGNCAGTTAVAGCPVGFSAAAICSSQFVLNSIADPLLAGAIYPGHNWQPGAGSAAYGGNAGHGRTVKLPADGFFTSPCFVGAIGPNPEDDWTQGWTYYDSLGTNRQDLHLPGMPDPRPLAVYQNINLFSPQTWGPDSNYLVRGQLRVKSQSRLTIAAGTVIFQERATLGTTIVERGAQIFALGTRTAPIIYTTDAPPDSQVTGSHGGIIIHGRATTNAPAGNACLGDSAASEGGVVGFYGGSDDNDNSGVLRYVRVEFAGKEITANNELNSFTFNAVGRGTVIEYLQAHRSADDHFEPFGGAADFRYILGTDGTDDGFDWQMGYHGRAQFGIMRQWAFDEPAVAQNGDRGIEADNKENDENNVTCSGRANPTVANFTFVGDRRTGPLYPGVTGGILLRRGTAGQVFNSIVYNWKQNAVSVVDNSTYTAHCAAVPAQPGLQCDGLNVGVPVAEGRLFVSQGAPNPFRGSVAIRFALPQAGKVAVHVYGADGRLVKTLVNGTLAAGPHSFDWNVDRGMPSGVYFYRVLADGAESSGKIVRID